MKRLFWSCLFLLAAGLLWWGVSSALVPTVAWTPAKLGNVISLVPGSISVFPERTSQLESPDTGIILPKGFTLKEGDQVAADQLLACLDPGDIPSLQNEATIKLESIKSQLDVNNAFQGRLPGEIELGNLKRTLDDKKLDLDAGFIGKADYEELQQTYAAKQAAAVQERADLETQEKVLVNQLSNYETQLKRLEIRAPYDGYITAVFAHPGDMRSKGDPIASMISSELKIQAEVNQDDIAAVRKDERAEIHFFAYTDKIPATVKMVLPSSDKATQRFTVLLEVANLSSQVATAQSGTDVPTSPHLSDPPIKLMAGLTGEVSFIAGHHDNVLTIPRRALFGNSVFVVKDGHIEVRQVQPGYVTLTQAEIMPSDQADKTVHEGEIILTEKDSLDLFRNGDRVRLAPVVKSAGPAKP